MSIEFLGLTYVADCDFCSEQFDTDVDRDEGFMSAIEAIKSEGWRVFKQKGEWVHKCPSCVEDVLI